MHCTAFELFLVRLKFNTIIASIIIIIKIIINVLLWSLASYLLATNNPSSSVQCMPMVSHIVIYVGWYHHHHHHNHDDHCDDYQTFWRAGWTASMRRWQANEERIQLRSIF